MVYAYFVPNYGWNEHVSPLITTDELRSILGSVGLYDIRWDLTDPDSSRLRYQEGHIPGAVFVDLDTDLAGEPGVDGRHPLPGVEEFASTLGRLGISPDTDVVVYDDDAGRYASRLWWMLRSIGHERVRVLDGGLHSWEGPLEKGSAEPVEVQYPVPKGFTGVVSHDQLSGRLVVDARATERYRGDIEPVDPKAGHIPGAINISTNANLQADGRFRDIEELRQTYQDLREPVMSCGSGVTACHDALAMVAAGLGMPDVYIGSFSEWSRRDLPVTTGDEP